MSITFSNIQIEEVTVQSCLNTSSNNGNKIVESLIVVAINPVDDVQCTIGTQSKKVVAGDTFSFTSL